MEIRWEKEGRRVKGGTEGGWTKSVAAEKQVNRDNNDNDDAIDVVRDSDDDGQRNIDGMDGPFDTHQATFNRFIGYLRPKFTLTSVLRVQLRFTGSLCHNIFSSSDTSHHRSQRERERYLGGADGAIYPTGTMRYANERLWEGATPWKVWLVKGKWEGRGMRRKSKMTEERFTSTKRTNQARLLNCGEGDNIIGFTWAHLRDIDSCWNQCTVF